MKHIMPMMWLPFKKLLSGSKKVEVRLYTEKCQKIRPNDIIEFECKKLNDRALCQVKGFLVFDTVETMVELLPPEVFGYDNREEIRVRLNRMFSYEEQHKYGVIGIIIDCFDARVHNHAMESKENSLEEEGTEKTFQADGEQARMMKDEEIMLEKEILEKSGRDI